MQPLRLVGKQQACVTGNLDKEGEGTSKHSGSLAHGLVGRPPELAGGLPEASGKGRVQSGTFKHVPDTDGKAGPGRKPVPPAVKQADGKNLP